MSYIYDEADANGLVKNGDYEAIIERMEVKTLPSGRNKLSVAFRIRDDVDQAYKNKWMFKDIWESKEEPGIFNRKQISQLLGTQNTEDGQVFDDINKVISYLEGCPLIIHITSEFDDYRGENVNTISYYKKTKIVPKTVNAFEDDEVENATSSPAVAKEGIVIGDDDLPF